MRRVLYLMPNAVPGGAERATMLMLAHHDRARYEPGVLFFSKGPLVDEASCLGVGTHVLSRRMRLRDPISIGAAIAECSRLIRDSEYAIVHSCMSYAHLIGGIAAARAHVPAVLYQHGPLGSWMDRAATMVRCDQILANSRFTADEQLRHSWRRRPITIAPYGIDLRIDGDERRHMREVVDARHGLSPDATVIGIIARFDPWKGIDVALRAIAPLLRQRATLRFVVIGGQYRHFHPTYGDQLRAIVSEEDLGEKVIFTGFQMDVRPYYARLNVLLHSSLQPEPFGLTIIEAMAAGVPVVAARGGGPAEIVTEGVDGLLHTPGSGDELRESLVRILDDTPARESMIAAAHRKIEAIYRPAAMMRTIEATYDQLLGSAA